MSLHDLMAFAVLAHRCFDGVYKRAHWVMVQDLNLFPQVRYNKVVERLHRYEELLRECARAFWGCFGALEGLVAGGFGGFGLWFLVWGRVYGWLMSIER